MVALLVEGETLESHTPQRNSILNKFNQESILKISN